MIKFRKGTDQISINKYPFYFYTMVLNNSKMIKEKNSIYNRITTKQNNEKNCMLKMVKLKNNPNK